MRYASDLSDFFGRLMRSWGRFDHPDGGWQGDAELGLLRSALRLAGCWGAVLLIEDAEALADDAPASGTFEGHPSTKTLLSGQRNYGTYRLPLVLNYYTYRLLSLFNHYTYRVLLLVKRHCAAPVLRSSRLGSSLNSGTDSIYFFAGTENC